jgi:predicted Fe-Mo cluster-binding NifX family protein
MNLQPELTVKIAVPTNDGNLVSPSCCRSRGFIVATVQDGKIVAREMRWNLLSEMMTSGNGLFYNLSDCDVLLLRNPDGGGSQTFASRDITVEATEATEVSDAFRGYLKFVTDFS